MCLYSVLLIIINKRLLPGPIRNRSYRLAALVWATIVFGTLAALTIRQQLAILFGAAT
jgi:hypothetical protein